jgi:prepilin-type N-terminal cleavage/methylation domain-containing protein
MSGFTVIEVLITMVLSGIVILAAFLFYLIFNKLIIKKNNDSENLKEVLQFYDILHSDTSCSLSIRPNAEGISMQFAEKDIVMYEFTNEYAVRFINNVPDTFNLEIVDFNTETDLTTGFIKIITLEIRKNEDAYPITIEKKYHNDVLLNRTIFPEK